MATHEDAKIVLGILQWAAQVDLDSGLAAIYDESFDPETAHERQPEVRKVLGFGEIVGTFVKNGVLDRTLAYDMWTFQFSWSRLAPTVQRMREHTGVARLYENFEALAAGEASS
jgi:hypothetical protein